MVAGLIYIVNRPILVGLLGLICGMFYYYGWVLRGKKKKKTTTTTTANKNNV